MKKDGTCWYQVSFPNSQHIDTVNKIYVKFGDICITKCCGKLKLTPLRNSYCKFMYDQNISFCFS